MQKVEKEIKQVNTIVATLNTKVPMKARIKSAKEYILGLDNATNVGVQLKYLAKFMQEIYKKEVKEKIEKDTEKTIKEDKNFAAAKMQIVHSFWDFKKCNHPEYNQLKEIKEKVDNRLKEIEEELILFGENTIKESGKVFEEGKMKLTSGTKNIVVEYDHELTSIESSEFATINPPTKISKEGLKYYLSSIEEK